MWQQLIVMVLGADFKPYIFVYFNIVVGTPSAAHHLQGFREIFNSLALTDLTLSVVKCKFFTKHKFHKEVKFLGYAIKRHVDPDMVKAFFQKYLTIPLCEF